MNLRFLLLLNCLPFVALAQLAHTPESIVKNLALTNVVPDGLLAQRAVVLFEGVKQAELDEAQKAFQQTVMTG